MAPLPPRRPPLASAAAPTMIVALVLCYVANSVEAFTSHPTTAANFVAAPRRIPRRTERSERPSDATAAATETPTSGTSTARAALPSRDGRDGLQDDRSAALLDRRFALAGITSSAATLAAAAAVAALSSSLLIPLPSLAADSASSPEPYTRRGKDFAYAFAPPPGFEPTNKPLKTHLDEINFVREGARGYQYGITVDPVRIDSLRKFGTPEEVAARVVTAEVNRDGVFEVTLARDPVEDEETGSYRIEYISDSKRGKKRFVTRIFVNSNKLYVLTAQAKEEDYTPEREREIAECADTFQPLSL